MSTFREQLVRDAEVILNGPMGETVLYEGREIRAIFRYGSTGEKGNGYSSDGSSTDGSLRVKLSDVPNPVEGDNVIIQGKRWAVVREGSRSIATTFLEIRSDLSVF